MVASAYEWPIPSALLPKGFHAVEVHACNVDVCGPSAVYPFEILGLLPLVPLNPRLTVGVVPVTTAQAIQIGDSYAVIARGWKLTTTERTALGLRSGGLTVGSVLATMDKNYPNLLTGGPLTP